MRIEIGTCGPTNLPCSLCAVVRKAEAEPEDAAPEDPRPQFFFGWSDQGKFVTAIFAT
jgi:hypothetical protein